MDSDRVLVMDAGTMVVGVWFSREFLFQINGYIAKITCEIICLVVMCRVRTNSMF
jgi:hypothetical protein